MPTLLSSRQRAILEAMVNGARLHRKWTDVGERYALWDFTTLTWMVVDGRSVDGLVRRGLLGWQPQTDLRGLTDAGRRAVAAPEGGG